jgi:hypothetical protein
VWPPAFADEFEYLSSWMTPDAEKALTPIAQAKGVDGWVVNWCFTIRMAVLSRTSESDMTFADDNVCRQWLSDLAGTVRQRPLKAAEVAHIHRALRAVAAKDKTQSVRNKWEASNVRQFLVTRTNLLARGSEPPTPGADLFMFHASAHRGIHARTALIKAFGAYESALRSYNSSFQSVLAGSAPYELFEAYEPLARAMRKLKARSSRRGPEKELWATLAAYFKHTTGKWHDREVACLLGAAQQGLLTQPMNLARQKAWRANNKVLIAHALKRIAETPPGRRPVI